MQLLTIDDLERTPPQVQSTYIQYAQMLHQLWHSWKQQHDGNMTVTVTFKGERDRGGGVHASELSGCRRPLVYSLMKTPRMVRAAEKDVGMQRRFDMGTMVHALTQQEFHEMCAWYNSTQNTIYLVFEDEVRINTTLGGYAEYYDANSSCDGCFVFYRIGVGSAGEPIWVPFLRVGLEIKTSSHDEYVKLKEPKDEHKEQTCFYMRMLDVPFMWTLYINKNNQKYTSSDAPFLFKFNKHLWENALKRRIEEGKQMAAAGQLPARSEGIRCGWCPFAHACGPTYLQNKQGASQTISPRDL